MSHPVPRVHSRDYSKSVNTLLATTHVHVQIRSGMGRPEIDLID